MHSLGAYQVICGITSRSGGELLEIRRSSSSTTPVQQSLEQFVRFCACVLEFFVLEFCIVLTVDQLRGAGTPRKRWGKRTT